MTNKTRRDYEQIILYMITPGPWNGGKRVPYRHYEIAGRAMLEAGTLDMRLSRATVVKRVVRILQECIRLGVEI